MSSLHEPDGYYDTAGVKEKEAVFMRELKLVIIGGGSSYTPELIDGEIIHRESLPVMEIVQSDIPE